MAISDRTLKQEVAEEVKAAIKRLSWSGLNTLGILSEYPAIEVHDLGPLLLQIRVKTQSSGIHYYTVKISEMI